MGRNECKHAAHIVKREESFARLVDVDEGVAHLVYGINATPLAHRLALELGEREAIIGSSTIVVLATRAKVVEQLVFGYFVAEEKEPAGFRVVFAHEPLAAHLNAGQVVEGFGDELMGVSFVLAVVVVAVFTAHLVKHSRLCGWGVM